MLDPLGFAEGNCHLPISPALCSALERRLFLAPIVNKPNLSYTNKQY